jgi:hypothetical protein
VAQAVTAPARKHEALSSNSSARQKKQNNKKGLVECLKLKALNSNPSTTKKKKSGLFYKTHYAQLTCISLHMAHNYWH